ncbi:N-acetyltransferase [Intrasporangium calvum]|uniref:N-acetyltransferase n=1 Tax=Intrasporangium calvum TaxID=53358 RepID=A0ABT5GDB3_9MICO|nr:GNAT family N-acetyltransferase [Intrasporangium calvum]MDC5696261.1 N-acetyltransferase [Intrasporangium calvum]
MQTDPQTGGDVTEQSTADPVVTHNPDRSRFEIAVGETRAGFTEYTEQHRRRIFFHTEVDEEYSGQGLAAILVRQALNATREHGLRIVAVCPYVARYVQQHPGWTDIVDAVDAPALDAVRRATR